MKTFSHVIKDEIGIHARPAGLLAKKAKEFKSEVTIEKDGKAVSAVKLMAVMGLGVKRGDTIRVRVSGADEGRAAEEIRAFLEENL